jgi:hypothetical protein
LRGGASNVTQRDCVKRKKDRDQASAWQGDNLEIDVRADVLDDGADPYGALLNELFHGQPPDASLPRRCNK